MKIEAVRNHKIDAETVESYFCSMINRIFKILPIREQECESLPIYIESLQDELLGCGAFVRGLDKNELFLSLLATLQYLGSDVHSVKVVRREVFRAIGVCEKLRAEFSAGGGANE